MPRPVRNKKIVDYSQNEDFDDDEDFACTSAPPSKKPRLKVDEKQKKGKSVKKDSQEAKVKKELPNERLPLDEKVYQRNLKTALIISAQESTCEDKTTVENEGPSVRPRQRQAASGAVLKQRKILLDDRGSDGECEKESGSEQDYITTEESESNGSNTDTDEEFTFKNTSNKNKKQNTIKVQTKTKEKKCVKSNSKDTALVPEKSKPSMLTEISFSPTSPIASQASSPSTGLRKPKWTPPASKENSNAPLDRVFVKSPSQGLRLGLSRFAKVKPLHPSADNN
ncbi:RAD51-associated protein 1 isoform X2 [Hemitrygon akajei]|uniref:RAD51-associated protein 1 isoform X2 n=1 Tax=Hemitrygon akajei TaxID=2704970 RepID=UPI003BF9CFD4